MKKFVALNVLVAICLMACLGFTTSQSRQGGLTESIKRGKEVYTQNCLACHQADGGGVPRLNPPLIKTKWVLGDKPTLIGVVLKGMNEEIEIDGETYQNVMPAHQFLTDPQVADVLTFVRNSFTNKASAITPAEVKKERAKIK
ncbi:MAG: c-type cytochrome [Chitinophagaceae bacterium]